MYHEPLTHVGDTRKTKYGVICCIAYKNAANVTVRFEDGTEVSCRANAFRQGLVKNPNFPTASGIGWLGVGKYSQKGHLKLHNLWRTILAKSVKDDESVDTRWLNFQIFCADMIELDGYTTDTRMEFTSLYDHDKPVWSKDNCIFVPAVVNRFWLRTLHDRTRKYLENIPWGVRRWESDDYQKKYYACITKFGKSVHLGSFDTVGEAHTAFVKARITYLSELKERFPQVDNRLWKKLESLVNPV